MPAAGRKLGDLLVRVRGDAEQDVLEIVERRDLDQFAALDERIQECRAACTFKAAREGPVLATDRDDAELVLGVVGVDRDSTILGEALQGAPLIRQIAHGVTEWRFRQDGPSQGLAFGVDLRQHRDRTLQTK